MPLIVVGLSHKTAPLELREKLAFPQSRLEEVLPRIKSAASKDEITLLSTCNRTEIYCSSEADPESSKNWCVRFLNEQFRAPGLENHLYVKSDREMIEHLFRVSSGLDSLVVGENEILKQVKDAYLLSQKSGLTGKVLNVLFQRALYVGKLIRSQTAISQGAMSVGSVAVSLAEKIFGDLSKSAVLIFGAGKMAEVSARYLLSRQVGSLWVANRTYENAVALAQKFSAEPMTMEQGMEKMALADIVVASTAASSPIFSHAFIEGLMQRRHNRSLFLIDIALPRNVEPSVHQMDNVYLYNLNDLESIVQENALSRSGEVEKAARIIAEKSAEFEVWVESLKSGEEISLKHNPGHSQGI